MTGGIRDEEGRVRPGVHIPKTAMDELKRLKESNAELLTSLKEMRDVAAAMAHIIDKLHGVDLLKIEFDRLNLELYAGNRAEDLIGKIESETP